MIITVYTLEKAEKELKVYFVSERAEDFSEVIYQEYETEGYSIENHYSESAQNWNPKFIQKIYDAPNHMYIEER